MFRQHVSKTRFLFNITAQELFDLVVTVEPMGYLDLAELQPQSKVGGISVEVVEKLPFKGPDFAKSTAFVNHILYIILPDCIFDHICIVLCTPITHPPM